MDFFVVPTATFRLLYVWFAIGHGRRRILHFDVTANPAAAWVIQQLREAFPVGEAPLPLAKTPHRRRSLTMLQPPPDRV